MDSDSLALISDTFVPSVESAEQRSALDQVTAMLHVRLRPGVPRAQETFEGWMEGVTRASQHWKPGAWAGKVVLKVR